MTHQADPQLTAFMTLGQHAFDGVAEALRWLVHQLVAGLLPEVPTSAAVLSLPPGLGAIHLAPLFEETLWDVPPLHRNRAQRLAQHLTDPVHTAADRTFLARVERACGQRRNRKPGRAKALLEQIQRLRPTSEVQRQAWLLGCGDALKLHLEGAEPGFPPAMVWQWWGAHAWGELAFRLELQQQLHDFFWRRVPIPAGQRPMPALDPLALWGLLALALPGLADEVGEKVMARRLRLLAATATRFALSPQWMMFWDQWLLLKALRARGEHDAPAQLATVVANLPLNSPQDGDDHAGADEAPPESLAHPDWRRSLPAWYADWHDVLLAPTQWYSPS